jgi:hypothetical protein
MFPCPPDDIVCINLAAETQKNHQGRTPINLVKAGKPVADDLAHSFYLFPGHGISQGKDGFSYLLFLFIYHHNHLPRIHAGFFYQIIALIKSNFNNA